MKALVETHDHYQQEETETSRQRGGGLWQPETNDITQQLF